MNDGCWRLKPSGALVLAGFFSGDAPQVIAAAEQCNFRFIQERNENDWVALHFVAS